MERKILFVCYDGYRTTNARVRCYGFAKELNRNGIFAEVFSFKDNLNASHDGYESYKVRNSEKVNLLVRAIKRLLQEREDTVFYIQKAGYFALAPYFVHLIKGNKFILDYDDYEYEHSIISKPLLRLLAKNAVFCVAANHYLQRFLKRFNRRVYYIPTGVDLDVFKKRKIKRTGEGIVFSWMGIIVDREALQNVLFIVDCFNEITRKYKNVRLEIVGGGEYMRDVQKLLNNLKNPKIKYIGRLKPEEIPDYLSQVDVGLYILIKNTKYNQSKSPTKLFEYMAMGLAVVATRLGESKYFIKDEEDGFLVSSKKEFVEKIERLIKNKQMILGLGEKAQKKARGEYNLGVLCGQLSEIIKSELRI